MANGGIMGDRNGKTAPFGGFHHVSLKAGDFRKSLAFYIDGLGLTEKIRWGEGEKEAVMLDAGNGNYVEIFAGGSKTEKPAGAIIHFALRTASCDASLERARKAGGVVTVEPNDVVIEGRQFKAPVRIAFCKGPDGEEIEFFQGENL
jgi:glyoxylase I family protein